MLETRSRLNTVIPDQEDAVFDYVENFRENIELAFMAVVMTVCNPVILCVKEPNAVTNFMNRVLLMANKLAEDETTSAKRVLIIVQNSCSLETIEDSKKSAPAFIRNARESRRFAKKFFKIEFVAIPDFKLSPQQQNQQFFCDQVGHLRTLIDEIVDETPLDRVLSSVERVVKAAQDTPNDAKVDVSDIMSRSTEEFSDKMCVSLKEHFEASASNFNGMNEQEFNLLQNQVRELWETLKLPESCANMVESIMTPWMRDQFDTRFRACPQTCKCARSARCSIGRIGHEGLHKCDFTEPSSCSRCTGRNLQCNDRCQHCQTTCANHTFSYCTKSGSHSSHLFSCLHIPKCERENCEAYTAKAIHCGEQFICDHCSCSHKFVREHRPINGRCIFGAHWECATRGCKFNNDASLWDTIRNNERTDGCIQRCEKGCGFEKVNFPS
ncbi:hypothetical protein PHMEG_00013293 [Phytophthora megakarya]|uniref:Uncharacterized protein n=1 Tax=Phytophthora megakarya TaxID=4795 RepID=A0A225W983_9STRA|nr:hypothetical protein PHMEG_00013293 [Phytophthora megakarya]